MIVDQAPEGIEVLRGSGTYVYDGNWKLQAENGADGYHVTAVHWNYAATQGRRTADGKVDDIKAMSAGGWAQEGRRLLFLQERPHAAVDQLGQPGRPPAVGQARRVVEKFGEAKADWMLGKSRNLCLYPNVYLMDQFSSQIRVLRPISVKTEATIYCIAPKGEPRSPCPPPAPVRGLLQRHRHGHPRRPGRVPLLPARLQCGRAVKWNDMTRGATHWVKGAGRERRQDRPRAELSGVKTEDEGLYVVQHQYWLEAMKKAAEAEQKGAL
jgi:benzoate/toluate 1,2-dioxygenase alpha subunit